MALFVPSSNTEQPFVLLIGDFIAFLVLVPGTKKVLVLHTDTFVALFDLTPGTETSSILPTGVASDIKLRQNNAFQDGWHLSYAKIIKIY